MPTLTDLNNTDITPATFLANCSAEELYEVHCLMQQEHYLDALAGHMIQRISLQLQADELNYGIEFCDQETTHQLFKALTHE
jgi:hypothetical protein